VESDPSRARVVATRLMPLVAALVTGGVHARFLTLDGALPVGDAAGHLLKVGRHLAWLQGGGPLPLEAFPPGLYVVAAWMVAWIGPTVDAAALGTVAFASLLGFTLSWLGLRAGGPFAGVLLPLVALATPMLSASARILLLDLPATALIVVVWTLAWESGGFRRPVPTVLMGVALGVGALVKYTLFPWVLPFLVLTGVTMFVRSPTSLLPLVFAAYPGWLAVRALVERSGAPAGTFTPARLVGPVNVALGVGVVGALVVIVGVFAARRRGKDSRWVVGLADGAWLAIAAICAMAVVLPWFLYAMPVVWSKVRHEAIEEVRTSGVAHATTYIRALVVRSWPGAWWLLQGAAALELAWQAWVVRARWASSSWGRGAEPPRNAPPDAPRFGPSVGIALSCVLGTLFTLHRLPVDPRYYLPLLAGAGIVLGLGAYRFKLGRWALAPALALLLLDQLAAEADFGWRPAARLPLAGFDASAATRLDPWGPFAPPAPASSPLADALVALVDAVEARPDAAACGAVLLAVPHGPEARANGFETGGIAPLALLRGVPECAFVQWEIGTPAPPLRDVRYLAVAGVRADQVRTFLVALPADPGPALLDRAVDPRVVRLHPFTGDSASPMPHAPL
jgi:hypothetical protein